MSGEETQFFKVEKFSGKRGDDFPLWKMRMQVALSSKGLYDAVGPLEQAAAGETAEVQEARKAKALMLIVNSLGDMPLRAVMAEAADCPRKMWAKLESRYASTSETAHLTVASNIANMKLQPGGSVMSYMSDLDSLYDRLETMGEVTSSRTKIAKLLTSVPEEYASVSAALRTQVNGEKSWNEVQDLMQDEYERIEQLRGAKGGRSSGSKVLYTREQRRNVVCYKCGKKGHIKKYCKAKGSGNDVTEDGNAPKESRERDPDQGSRSSARKAGSTRIKLLMARSGSGVDGTKFVLDSGASRHMVSTSEILTNIKKGPKHEVFTASGQRLEGDLYGDLQLEMKIPGGFTTSTTISNVLVVPELSDNLISVDALAEKGVHCKFTSDYAYLLDAGDEDSVIGYGKPGDDGLRYLDCETILQSKASLMTSSESLDLWHDRLAHTACSTIETMIADDLVNGLQVKGKEDTIACESCCAGKITRGPFKGSNNSAQNIGDVTHSDLAGPLPATLGGKRYMASFIDEKCRSAKIALLEKKNETKAAFIGYQKYFERQNHCKLKALRVDQGGEYTAMKPYLKENGIEIQFSAAYCPESSGLAERFNRTILDMVRTMLVQSGLEETFWGEAAAYANYIRERIMTKTPDGVKKSPLERRTGTKPNVKNIKVFGCLAFVHKAKPQRKTKLGSRGWKGIFLGITENGLYKVLDKETARVHMVRNVRFDEKIFPAQNFPAKFVTLADSDVNTDTEEDTDTSDDAESNSEEEELPELRDESDYETEYVTGTEGSTHTSEAESEGELSEAEALEEGRPHVAPGSSTRIRRPPQRYQAGVTKCLKLKPGTEDVPTVNQALEGPEAPDWLAAIQVELEQLKERKTWRLIPRSEVPAGCNVLPSSIKLKQKRLEDGSVDKKKARLCVGGHKQKYGVDYDETFAPVIDFETVRLILSIAAKEKMLVDHVDVIGAFLFSHVDAEIYVEQPKGFEENPDADEVCKLLKGLYGIKQGSKLWGNRLSSDLIGRGFKKMPTSPCLFYHNEKKVILIVYVDDGLIAAKTAEGLAFAKNTLHELYDISDLGPASWFLGVGIRRLTVGIAITQKSYIENTLEKFGLSDARPASTPTEMGIYATLREKTPSSAEDKEAMAGVPYRELVGALLFISTRTRPDICVSVGLAARRVADPRQVDWEGAKRILRYLKGTKELALLYSCDGCVELEAFADADFASTADRRSVSGSLSRLSGSAAHSWGTNKQGCVALSTSESEIISQAQAARNVVHERNVLEFIEYPQEAATTIYQDNTSAIVWSEEGKFSGKAKHISVKYHYAAEQILAGNVTLEYVSTKEMVADCLTKVLPGPQLKRQRELIGLRELKDEKKVEKKKEC